MKKIYAAFCLTAALFFSSCDVFMNSKNDETSANQSSEKPADKPEDRPDENPGDKPADTTPAFEYTADNDLSAATAPFDKKLCYQNADSLELSDGDWTLNDVYVSEGILNTKIILKGSAANNKIEWKSAVIKFDMSAESESTNESQQALSEQDEFKEAFDQVKTLIFGDKSEYVTFSNGYLTDDKLVYIAKVQLDKVDDICRLENKISNSAIKTNPNKTKYVIQYDNEGDGIIYLYKNANLNDKETIPENPGEEENQEQPKQPENPDTSLTRLYNAQNDIPAATAPFNASLCPQTGRGLSFSNGKWKIVDIVLGKDAKRNYDFETITDVTFTDGEYDCTSSISKYDFPKNSADETFDYEGTFNSFSVNPYIKTFSHGYSTNSKHVIIIKNDPKLFEQVYLAQINNVPASSVKSNLAGTKFIIPYYGNGCLQNIYIFKEYLDENGKELPGYDAPDLPESLGSDPFAGKTFGDADEKYEFGNDNTITYYRNISVNPADPDVRATFKYQYTYNASTKLLTYSCIAMMNELTGELGSFNEIKESIPEYIAGSSDPEELYNYYLSSVQELFENPKIWKAELSAGKLSLRDPYYTEVPDLNNVNLQLKAYFNNSIEVLLGIYQGNIINIETHRDGTGADGTIHVSQYSIKTKYEITTITADTITATEVEKKEHKAEEGGGAYTEDDYYKVDNPNPATISIKYENARTEDGIICIDISGKDDISKQALGAKEDNLNPSYTLKTTNDSAQLYEEMN